MYDIIQSDVFERWLRKLKDPVAKAQVLMRLERIRNGDFGDFFRYGPIDEFRVHYGPGYRLYGRINGNVFVVFFCGGVKTTQSEDIALANQMAKNFKRRK